MRHMLREFIRRDDGQDLIEYAFLAVFIALVVLVGISAVGSALNNKMSTIAGTLSSGS